MKDEIKQEMNDFYSKYIENIKDQINNFINSL